MATLQSLEPMVEDYVPQRRSTFLGQIVRRLVADPNFVVGTFLLALMVVVAIIAPLIGRYDPDAINLNILNQGPSMGHWFGTDYLGRDMFARVIYGGRISLPAGIEVVGIAFLTGVPLGLIAGYGGGVLDDVIMRFMDVLLSFPPILLAISVIAILGSGLQSAIIAVGVAMIPNFARLARGSALRVREMEYVEGSRAFGASNTHILARHILPNLVDPLIVLATLSLGGAILATAALSFLGLGTQPPTSDWGVLVSQGYEHMFQSASEVTFPGLAIIVAVLGVNLLGDALSDAMDPRQWSR